jgi:alkanesulfonate monooxygenase SsuD/methylene tetrahydromethanopterin reductase-like flavin-dependent oxidoreductase (luciferase family)
LLHKYAREAGRDPNSIEISSLSTTFVSSDKGQGDAMAKRAAENMGLPDAQGARNFPMLLVGTPEEVRREIRNRIEEFNITYFVLSFMSDDSLALFAREVMPEFAG